MEKIILPFLFCLTFCLPSFGQSRFSLGTVGSIPLSGPEPANHTCSYGFDLGGEHFFKSWLSVVVNATYQRFKVTVANPSFPYWENDYSTTAFSAVPRFYRKHAFLGLQAGWELPASSNSYEHLVRLFPSGSFCFLAFITGNSNASFLGLLHSCENGVIGKIRLSIQVQSNLWSEALSKRHACSSAVFTGGFFEKDSGSSATLRLYSGFTIT